MADVSLLFNILARDQTAGGINSATSRMDKFKHATSVAALGILAGATAIGAKAIEIASDTSESASKVQTLFGKSAASINAFADSSAKAYGMSKLEALNAVGSMGAVQIAMGVNAEQAAKTSTEYVKLSADLASFNNASSAEVQEALTGALSGEYEMLKKYGIVVNDSTMSLEAQRIGMKKTGATWTEAQKQQLSYNIIMKSTKAAQGDFARTSGGLANQTKILQATMSDLQGELGAKLLPIVVSVMNTMNNAFGWMERHQTTTKVLAITIGGLAAAIVTLSVGFRVAAAVTNLWAMGWRLLATVMWANPVFIIAGIIIAIGVALVVAYKKSETFRKVVNAAFQGVKTFVISAIQVLANTILGFWGMIIHGAAKAFGWIPGIGGKLKAADRAFGEFRDSVNAKLNGIKNRNVTVTVQMLKKDWDNRALDSAGKTMYGPTIPARASGGPVKAGGTYLVGEEGPEVVTMGGSGYVTPNDQLGGGGRMLTGRRGGGTLVLDVRGTDRLLLELFRRMVRTEGGGNVQKAFGTG